MGKADKVAAIIIVVVVVVAVAWFLQPRSSETAQEKIFESVDTITSTGPEEKTAQPKSQSCDPSYPDVCIRSFPPDLDCDEIPYTDFRVTGVDPHDLDPDSNGIGCES